MRARPNFKPKGSFGRAWKGYATDLEKELSKKEDKIKELKDENIYLKMRGKWNYFLGKINFGASALDAKSIQIMNELGTEMDEAEQEIEKLKDIVNNCPELNMGNYDDDQVRELNNAMIELSQLLNKP